MIVTAAAPVVMSFLNTGTYQPELTKACWAQDMQFYWQLYLPGIKV